LAGSNHHFFKKIKVLVTSKCYKTKESCTKERSADTARCTELEVTLDDQQPDELTSIVNRIEEINADELEKIFNEADKHLVGDSVRAAWQSNR